MLPGVPASFRSFSFVFICFHSFLFVFVRLRPPSFGRMGLRLDAVQLGGLEEVWENGKNGRFLLNPQKRIKNTQFLVPLWSVKLKNRSFRAFNCFSIPGAIGS